MIAQLDLITNQGDVKWTIVTNSDGHKHIDLSNNQSIFENIVTLDIVTRVKSYDDIFILKQIVSAVRYVNPTVTFNLYITYLMGGLCDRRGYVGDSEDLKIICEDINGLNCEAVMVVEPHSIVTSTLLDNFSAATPMEHALADYIEHLDNQKEIVIFAPDLKAIPRTEQFILESQLSTPIGYLHKTRNLLTGETIGVKILSTPDLKDKTVILYSDICTDGKDVTDAATLFRTAGAKSVILCVTHGVFSKGIDILFNHETGFIDYIITTESFQSFTESDKIKIVPYI